MTGVQTCALPICCAVSARLDSGCYELTSADIFDPANDEPSAVADLLSREATDYVYDVNGSRVAKIKTSWARENISADFVETSKETEYNYDVNDRLVSVEIDGSLIFETTYDYRTRRLTKTENGETTYFRYDGGDCFQELESGTTNINVEFVRAGGLGGGIGGIVYSDRSMKIDSETLVAGPVEIFCYNPAVGHTMVTVNASNGSVVSTNLYEAFGNIVSESGSSDNNRLANTKERDASIGLDNHGFRYYDPEIGRYISRDPAGYPDGMNVYLYVRNNPINRIDPLGLGIIGTAYDFWKEMIVDTVLPKPAVTPPITGRTIKGTIGKAIGYFAGKHEAITKSVVAPIAEATPAGIVVSNALNMVSTGYDLATGKKGATDLIPGIDTYRSFRDKGVINTVDEFVGYSNLVGTYADFLSPDNGTVRGGFDTGDKFGKAAMEAELLAAQVVMVVEVGGSLLKGKLASKVPKAVEATPETPGKPVGVDTGNPHAPGDVPNQYNVVRGGIKEVPQPGTGVVCGSQGATLQEAGSGVPNNQLRATTAGEIRAKGGTVSVTPELNQNTGNINYRHVDVYEGGTETSFGSPQKNPATPAERIY